MTLDGRKGRILHAIVKDYVDTAEPIGSEWLVTRYDFGCKSATLRNEMAEMSDLGYLVQPHTSAGRIPSTVGYRYYVDNLMPPDSLSSRSNKVKLSAAANCMEVEEAVKFACKALSALTMYPSVATAPATDLSYLHRLFVSRASSRHLLLVMLLSTGGVEHRLIETNLDVNDETLQKATDHLNRVLSHLDVGDISRHQLEPVGAETEQYSYFVKFLHGHCREAARRLTESKVFLEGATHILRQREFQDVLRLEQLLALLEQRSVLFEVISRAIISSSGRSANVSTVRFSLTRA